VGFNLIIHDEAKREYQEGYKWYEEKQSGLGKKFTQNIEAIITRITKNPEHYPKKKKNYREAVVNVFPYIISYQIFKQENFIHISAIHHAKRNPRLKYRKLENA